MLIVIGIIIIISAIVISSQGSFNRSILLANTAYDVALSIRHAETYGLSSRIAGISVSIGYGIDVTRASPTTFTFFADSYPAPSTLSVCHPTTDAATPDAKPGDCAYDALQDEIVTAYTLGNGITISDFCAKTSGSWACATSNGSSLTSLDIVFSRPNPTPFMSVNGSYSSTFPVTDACLSLTSPSGGARFISVSSSGEIRATAASCP
ncbi:MAG: hypothetical protein Q7S95_02585 [bacterium]|nr:hypothetical protein [bacterium]